MYITSWAEFTDKAKELWCNAPEKSRYVLKYRPTDSEIVLKVTDDRKCLQYRTHMQNELRLINDWNYVMLKLCTTPNPNPNSITQEIEAERKAERESHKKGGRGKARQ